jgi:hypothetical protein
MGKNSGSGSGMNHPDHISKCIETIFFGLKYLNSLMRDGKNSDPGSGMERILIRDAGWKKLGSGIRDKHPGSATLPPRNGQCKVC